MSDPKHPQVGELVIDASDIVVCDLTPEQIAARSKVRPGFQAAVACLGRLTAAQRKAVGISSDEIDQSAVLLAAHNRIDEVLPAAEKLVELLRETRIDTDHQIAVILNDAASQARRRAERDPKAAEAIGVLQDLLDYVSAPALKGVATRTKGQQDAGSEPQAPESP
jgi:hypothetical protein